MEYGAGDKQRVPCRGQIFKGMNDDQVLAHMNNPAQNAQHVPGHYHNPSPTAPAAVYNHPDVPGAGARKRRKLHGKAKIPVVMHEFKRGTLRSGSGEHVTNPKQAIAIAMSEAGMSRKKKRK